MDLRQKVFEYRSYTPIPFLLVMIFFSKPTAKTLLLGFSVLAVGELLRLWGVAIAGSETRTTGPVGGTFHITTGPFAYVRNPLYLGNVLIYAGVGVMSNALFPWLTIIALVYFVVQYSLIVNLEEEHLAVAFGEEYRRYSASVPRFLPRMTKYRSGSYEQPKLDWKSGLQSETRTLQAITIHVVILTAVWLITG